MKNEIAKLFLVPEFTKAETIWKCIAKKTLDLASKNARKIIILTKTLFAVPESLKREFPKSTIKIVPPPYNRNDIVGLSEDIADGKIIVIAVSNLCNFSKITTPGFLSYPQQVSKIQKEAALLHALTQRTTSAALVQAAVRTEPRVCSAPDIVIVLSKIANHLGYCGEVIEYVDSYNIHKTGIDKYVTAVKPVARLVSYCGIAFRKKVRNNTLSELDKHVALAIIRSMLLRNIARKRYKLKLPAFHRFYSMHTGVFVRTGTQRKHMFTPSCSKGFLENGATSTADGFLSAVEACRCDNANRWRQPLSHFDINDHALRFELLEPRKSWRVIPGHRAQSRIRLDGRSGMRLVLASGGTALYLPHEARDFWNKKALMHALVKRAGGMPTDLKFAVAELFRSITFATSNH